MTDEEKAEEYANTHSYHKREYFKQAYLDGLKKGRKDEADKIFDEWCSGSHDEPQECGFLKQLKNENAELSNLVTELTNSKTELENKVTELKKQIEKMRRCTNCKLLIGGDCPYMWEYKETRKTKKKKDSYCVNYDKWELSE